MKLLCISDIHGEVKYIESAAHLLADADIVTISGDISRSGRRNSAEYVIKQIEQYNPNILAVHGNWDRIEVCDFLEERGYNLHSNGRIINDIGFFGVGGSNKTPMKTVSEYAEDDLYDFLMEGYNKVKSARTIVLISHAPPRNYRDRTFLGFRGGSSGIRNFIESHRIDLCISGHIHEAYGIEEFDSTIIANAGTFRKGAFIMVDIEESITLTTGRVR